MRRLFLLVPLLALLGGCDLMQQGPWVGPGGRELMGSEVIEFQGFSSCGWERVVFLQFYEDQYAKDPANQLGELRSPVDGEPLTFTVLDRPPPGVEGTGITHDGREILIGDDREEYLYIRLPDGTVERWPRAEVECEQR